MKRQVTCDAIAPVQSAVYPYDMSSGTVTSMWESLRSLARRGTPLFAMELRAHSRQGRTYAFRAIYVILLAVYVALLWQGAVSQAHAESGQAWERGIMADVGQRVTRNVLAFQFLAGQAAAIVLMCGAFSDEFARGRLPALLTSPLTDTQVVAGKYLSRLVQLLVLMLATLPVLAVVRLFGGVPWLFLLGGTALSLTAALFTAAITLLNSLKYSKPHQAALWTLPVVVFLCVSVAVACYTQPMAWALTLRMAFLGAACLAGTLVVMHFCRLAFPRAVRQAVGDWRRHAGPDLQKYKDHVYLPPVPDEVDVLSRGFKHAGSVEEILGPIDRVRGNPLFWKATRRRLRQPISPKLLLATIGVFVFYFYGGVLSVGGASAVNFHVGVLGVLMAVSVLWCGFLSACSIVMDKESGFWPLVLASPMDSFTIFTQRVRVIFRRSWLILAMAGGHTLVFAAALVLYPLVLLQVPVALAWAVLFTVAMGMYCSVRSRTTPAAVLATFSVLGALWLGVPLLAYLLADLAGGGFLRDAMHWLMAASPFTHLHAGLSGSVEHAGQFAPMTWRDGGELVMPAGQFLFMMTFWTTAYLVASVWLIHATIRSFRRRVYE